MSAPRGAIQFLLTLSFLIWLGLMIYSGATGLFYRIDHHFGLAPIQQAIVLPIALFLVAFYSVPRLEAFIKTVNLTFLVALQGIRILALSHIVCWGYGLMAGGFAIPVATGNLLVCILALAAVVPVAERRGRWRLRVYAITAIGILEFMMTIALAVFGLFTRSTPFDPPQAAGGYISFATTPLSIFPTVAIPILLIVHLTTLIALKHQTAE
jgi:hypothetical protein